MASDSPGRLRGRPPKYVLGRNGKPVIGLSRKSDGRYYATGSQPRVYFGRDFDRALIRFRELQARTAGETISFVRPVSDPHDEHEWDSLLESFNELVVRITPEGAASVGRAVPSDAVWATIRRLILADPRLAAEKTGLPLDRLHQFKEPDPSLPLSAVLDLYLNKPRAITRKTRRDTTQYWEEFMRQVKVKTLADLTADHISGYHDAVYTAYREGKSPYYVRARFTTIKAVLNHAAKRGKDIENLQRVLTFCRMLSPPAANGLNPSDISPADFRRLLEVADVKWRAILLLALNAALYPIDVCNLRKAAIDLAVGTFRDVRDKTGVPRIAVLWKRTVQAVRAYMKQRQHDLPNLFVSSIGLPYDPNHIGRGFRRLREEAGLPPSVQFAHLRDGAQTAAIEGGAEPLEVEFLLGHRTGIRDAYLKRKPTMVAKACRAIEKAYFG